MCHRVQVWSADAGVAHSPPSDLLWKSQTSWGTGKDMVTTLVDADGEVRLPRQPVSCLCWSHVV